MSPNRAKSNAARRRSKPATSRIFRERLRAARDRWGWTQSDLARAAGLQPSALSHYESGARRPSFTNLSRLAAALEVSTDYLVGHERKAPAGGDDLAAQIARLRPADRETVRALVGSLLRRT